MGQGKKHPIALSDVYTDLVALLQRTTVYCRLRVDPSRKSKRNEVAKQHKKVRHDGAELPSYLAVLVLTAKWLGRWREESPPW